MSMFIQLSDLIEAKKTSRSFVLRDRDRSSGKIVKDRKTDIPEPPKPRRPEEPKPPSDGNESDAVKRRLAAQAKRKKTITQKRKKAFAQAAADNKATRQARTAAVRAKSQEKPDEKPSLKSVPAQLAHCMMAVHVKRGKSKRAAWNICRWSLSRYGYLKGPYNINSRMPKATVQTAKGAKRSFQHGMEKKPLNRGVAGNGRSKFKKFVKMFGDLEPKIVPK